MSVLEWHPGGALLILDHAGKVPRGTCDEFVSIHDEYAYQNLEGISQVPTFPTPTNQAVQ